MLVDNGVPVQKELEPAQALPRQYQFTAFEAINPVTYLLTLVKNEACFSS